MRETVSGIRGASCWLSAALAGLVATLLSAGSASAAGTLIDLGALPGGTTSQGNAINNDGFVAGTANVADGNSHAFLWTPSGGMQDLGVLPGKIGSEGDVITDSGEVAGSSWSEFVPSAPTPPDAFLWTPSGGMQDVGNLGGSALASPIGMKIVAASVAGVAGNQTNPGVQGCCESSFLWTPSGGMQLLGGGDSSALSHAVGMNASGDVAGFDTNPPNTYGCPPNCFFLRAWLYTPQTGKQNLGALGGSTSSAFAINNDGWVVGSAATASGESHAFVWTPSGGMQDIDPLGGSSEAVDIDNHGEVLGSDGNGDFVWTQTAGLHYIADGGGGSVINDLGEVMGTNLYGGPSFVWAPSSGETVLPTSASAVAINGKGEVTGQYETPSGAQHAFVWIPSTSTSTSMSSSANPSLFGEMVTYTATVSPVPDGGTVAFSDDGNPISDCTAQTVSSAARATCQVAYTALGSHSITAAYSGDSNFAASTSSPLTQVVQETPKGLCQLTVRYVDTSSKYEALPPWQRAAINQILTGISNQLATITPKLNTRQRVLLIAAYKAAVTWLAQSGWLSPTQASTLSNLAGQLTIT